jgi:hypothetical protein
MTNIFGSPEKVSIRDALFGAAIMALEADGWAVKRIDRFGKASVRQISREGRILKASIRTTQDQWIAFPRNRQNNGWATLDDVDVVIASSVDDVEHPQFAKVHFIPADEVRTRFDRAYKARIDAGHSVPNGRGIWVSLYHHESNDPVNRVGAGVGIAIPPFPPIRLADVEGREVNSSATGMDTFTTITEPPLTIAEAKRRLAQSLGVNVEDIKITISN